MVVDESRAIRADFIFIIPQHNQALPVEVLALGQLRGKGRLRGAAFKDLNLLKEGLLQADQ